MGSRMDRYREDGYNSNSKRMAKNKKLYTSLDNNTKYTTITDVRNTNAVELTTAKKNYRTREGYHQIKEYGTFAPKPKVKKELDDFNYLYKDKENKVYDINSVIEEAKKNRLDTDEKFKTMKDSKYLLTKEEIDAYRNEKKNQNVPDKDSMKNLINTITSKTLKGEIDQETSVNLLSDLMATTKDDEIVLEKTAEIKENMLDKTDELKKDILDENALEDIQKKKDNYVVNNTNTELKDMDNSFYTRSMDLSDKDFDLDDSFVQKKKVPTVIKLFLVILLMALIAALVYFIIQSL